MNIEELWREGKLSNRAYNVCRRNKYLSTGSLQEHYNNNGGFKKLSNCGVTTEKELTKLIIPKSDTYVKESKVLKEVDVQRLSQKQKDVINMFIGRLVNSLENKCRNALNKYVTGKIYMESITIEKLGNKILYNSNFHVRKIKGIGKKYDSDILKFIEESHQLVKAIASKKNEEELNLLQNSLNLKERFSINEFPDTILNSLSLFPTLQHLITTGVFFNNPKKNYIFLNGLDILQNTRRLSLQELSAKVDLSPERVRQVRKQCLSHMKDNLNFLIKSQTSGEVQEIIENDGIFIKPQSVHQINSKYNTSFSQNFLHVVVYTLYKGSYDLLGKMDQLLIPEGKDANYWTNFYLIKREFSDVINFYQLFDDLYNRKNARIQKTYTINITEYLSTYCKDLPPKINLELSLFVKFFAKSELQIETDDYQRLIFNRNTRVTRSDYAYEVLEQFGKPAKLSKIQSLIWEKYSEKWISIDSLRSALLENKAFVSIGQSTYGLKIWEDERENFKGGSIRSITEELLEECDMPIHITEITNHILKFRPGTNSKSIYYNLKMDNSKTFTFRKNRHVGLKRKNYKKKP